MARTMKNSLGQSPVSVETLAAGDGRTFPASGDALTVHYTGRLLSDGTQFDCSREQGVAFTFVLGGGGVIRGWELGLASMSLGQRATLNIAASAAYGKKGCRDASASGSGVIPPDAALVFDVELLDINDARGEGTRAKLAAYRLKLAEWVAQESPTPYPFQYSRKVVSSKVVSRKVV